MEINYHILTLILPVAIMLHVTEEFLYPGGFIDWYKELVPPQTKGIRPGYLVWINTLMIGVCVLPIYFFDTERGKSIWFCVAAIAAINAFFHIYGVFKLKKYSPGVITGVLLYLPIFAFGSQILIEKENFPITKVVLFLAIAIGYHVFSVIRQAK